MRKIIQIVNAGCGTCGHFHIAALCDDGTVWAQVEGRNGYTVWSEIEPVPQGEPKAIPEPEVKATTTAACIRMRKLRAERARAKLKAEVVAELKDKLVAKISATPIPVLAATMDISVMISDALDEIAPLPPPKA